MIRIDDRLSRLISNLGFIAACLVVGIHVAGGPVRIPSVCGCAVPIFFAISGFLLAGSTEKHNWYCAALTKRVRTLLVPYLIICFGWWVVLFSLHTLAVKFAGANAESMVLSWRTPLDIFGLLFEGGPFAVGMWYIRALLILVVVSPLFVWAIKRSKITAWVTLIMAMILWLCFKFGDWQLNSWWRYFVTLGVPPYAVSFFVLGLFLRFEGGGWTFLRIIPDFTLPNWLVKNSFPLFVMHPMIIYMITFLLKGCHRLELLHSYRGYVIGWVLLIPVSCALAQFIKVKLPRIAEVVFGGR